MDEEESLNIADEFGLSYVGITSAVSDDRKPLKDITTSMKNSFASKQKQSGPNKNSKLHKHNGDTDLPHFKVGFNGLGGHSKKLVIPKRSGPLVIKGGGTGKGTASFNKIPKNVGFNKIPKNNTKITKFVHQHSSSTSTYTNGDLM